jgi:hypothetical protein
VQLRSIASKTMWRLAGTGNVMAVETAVHNHDAKNAWASVKSMERQCAHGNVSSSLGLPVLALECPNRKEVGT